MGRFYGCFAQDKHSVVWCVEWFKGLCQRRVFLLDSPTAVRDFIKLPIHSKSIKAALLEVTGVHFKLGLFKRPAEQSAPKRDPLEDLINQAQGSVNIEFK